MINLAIQRLPLVEPAKPTEVTEDSAANLRASNSGQAAVSFEMRAQHFISGTVARTASDNCRSEIQEIAFHAAKFKQRPKSETDGVSMTGLFFRNILILGGVAAELDELFAHG